MKLRMQSAESSTMCTHSLLSINMFPFSYHTGKDKPSSEVASYFLLFFVFEGKLEETNTCVSSVKL